jgi:hypothetical protein
MAELVTSPVTVSTSSVRPVLRFKMLLLSLIYDRMVFLRILIE